MHTANDMLKEDRNVHHYSHQLTIISRTNIHLRHFDIFSLSSYKLYIKSYYKIDERFADSFRIVEFYVD